MLAIVIILVLAIVFFAAVLKPSRKEKQALAEQEERLKDQRIYDSVTGRYLTLEEAENEVLQADDAFDRIKSDQEIEDNYSEDNREVEYIIRHMILLRIPETEDERILKLLEYSKLFEGYEYGALNSLWEIKPDHFLGIAEAGYRYGQGNNDLASDYQLFGIIQGKLLTEELKKFERIEFVEINQTQIFKISKKIKYSEFKKLKELIEVSDHPV